ncbi:LuxR C-terminal-related transcriptional regulator [Streptomyces chrestomyceticus]|uniref:LuxR C-terminal-related transcriptional regulator n=1 Tax=Streptomyces chrestomyceticus TaxID=68185 RepID=UPI0033D98CD7
MAEAAALPLILVAQGKTNKEIADAFDLAPNSMRTYLGTLRHKFGVHGHRATLALIAYRRRYVGPGTPEGEAPTLNVYDQRLLRRLADGLTINGIAASSGQTYDQVKVRVAQLFSQMGADTRIDAMRICVQHCLLDEDAETVGPDAGRRPGRAA